MQQFKLNKFSAGQDKVYINDPEYFLSLMTSSSPLFLTDITQHEMVKKAALTYYKLRVRSTNTNSSYEVIFNVPEEFSDSIRFVHNTFMPDDEDDTDDNVESKEDVVKKERVPEMVFIWQCESEKAIAWKTAISKIIELFTEQLRKNCTFNNEEPEVLNLAVNGVTLLNYRHKKIPINEFYTSFNPLEDTYQIILAGGYWANDRNEIGISWQIPCFKGMTVAKMHEKQIEAQLKRRKRSLPEPEIENDVS